MHLDHELLNLALWVAGLVLQGALVAALVVRQEARRFPAFTALLAFYTVRTTLLFALSGHIAGAVYGVLYGAFSWMDLLLQALVAAEVALHIDRLRSGRRWWSAGIVVLFSWIAGCAAWLAGDMLRASPRGFVDRGQMFTSCLLLLLFGWALWSRVSVPVLRICGGLAVYGVMSVLAQAGRVRAMAHRSAASFEAWSYIPVGVYLLVVIFWLITVAMGGEGTRRGVRRPWRSALGAANG